MSGNEIVVRQQPVMQLSTVETIGAMAKLAAMSGLVKSSGKDQQQRIADAFVVMSLGVELGMKPMTSLQTIHVINGKPTCSGQAMIALMKRGGCLVETPDPSTIKDSATIRIKHPNSPEFKSYTFTVDMAKKAGLWGSATWKKYPEMMLIWRAVSMGARMEAPDMISGLYTVEEIAPAAQVDEDGALIDFTGITEAAQPEPKPQDTWPEGEPGDGFTAKAQAIRWLSDTEGLSYCEVKTQYGVVSKRSEDVFVEACYLSEGELVGSNEIGKWHNFMPANELPLMMMDRDEQGRVVIDSVEEVFETYPPVDGELSPSYIDEI